MSRRCKYNWPELIKSFEASGLSQTEFCRQNNLNPKYFSLKRSKLLSTKGASFVKVEVAKPPATPASVTIQVGRCQIICPESMTVESFATLVHRLA